MTTAHAALAKTIHDRLGRELEDACRGSIVPTSFLAGLISVENARLDPEATRFEKHVFTRLKQLRNPLVVWRREWNGITQADLKGASDEALINLSTSYGLTQIMGWWSIALTRALGRPVTVGMIRNRHQHLELAVRLLEHTARRYLKITDFGAALRIWNTGKPDGRTYHANYVKNALGVMQQYRVLLVRGMIHTKRKTVSPRSTNDAPARTPTATKAKSP